MDVEQTLMELVNPVFNTGKMTIYQLATTGNKDAKSICEKLDLTFEDTQNSSNTKTSADQQKISTIMMEARFRTTYAMAEKSGCKTLVDLPCGYTPRGIQCAEKGISYVGLDLPATIYELEPIVRSLLSPEKAGLVKYAGVDATNYSSLEKALENVSGEICITTEGLLMYFSDYEVGELCDNIRKLLAKHGGCWITADPETTLQYVMTAKLIYGDQFEKIMLNSKQHVKDKSDVEIGQAQILVKPGKDIAENMKRSMSFLAAHGLKAERLTVADYMPELSFLKDEPELAAAYKQTMTKCSYWKITPIDGAQDDSKNSGNEFGVKTSMSGDTLEMALTGRVDTLTAPEILSAFEKLAAQEPIKSVSVDCSRLDYISSAGLRVLLLMQKKCSGGVALSGTNELVTDILQQTGFYNIFSIK